MKRRIDEVLDITKARNEKMYEYQKNGEVLLRTDSKIKVNKKINAFANFQSKKRKKLIRKILVIILMVIGSIIGLLVLFIIILFVNAA